MTQRIYALLGRAGDILNILPLLKKEADEGKRPAVMTQAPFNEILDGVSYCDCILTATPNDIPKTVEAAKKLSSDVVNLHPEVTLEEVKTGKFEQIKTDSWAKESWRLAGKMRDWKLNLPLVFDRRDESREGELCPDFLHERKSTILVATGGVSSPFRYKKALMTVLELRFRKPQWRILDIGKLKAHRLYDLIGLMEKARFLVTTDSSPMHLARAVPTLPVVALMNDRPSLWNGSPWRPEHIWTCRYTDFPFRWTGMIEAMDNAYHGPSAFTPSFARERPALIHTFSAYDGIASQAKENWDATYKGCVEWNHAPAWFGMFGRDSRFGGVDGERMRFPFVKDVLRAAVLRTKSDKDCIVLTRDDTCFHAAENGILNGEWLVNMASEMPRFSHRAIRDKDGNLTHHPAIDLFAFTKGWWEAHAREYPDMIMGRDYMWQRTLKALILKSGGREVPWLTYQSTKESNG